MVVHVKKELALLQGVTVLVATVVTIIIVKQILISAQTILAFLDNVKKT